jgi:hypothetical protein
MDITIAMHTSQSSNPNWRVVTLPTARAQTNMKARAGKKKLTKMAKI